MRGDTAGSKGANRPRLQHRGSPQKAGCACACTAPAPPWYHRPGVRCPARATQQEACALSSTSFPASSYHLTASRTCPFPWGWLSMPLPLGPIFLL